jgi:cysteine desulfurase
MPYFDHNATTPLCPPAREAWLRVQERLWHNASSLYREAAAARDELERCRERLAEMTGTADAERIVFTSGATEGCNGFFRGLAEGVVSQSDGRTRVLVSPFEHPAVREPAHRFCGAEVIGREVLEEWRKGVDPVRAGARGGGADRAEGHSPSRVVVAWMAANNETGEVFPWRDWTAWFESGAAGGNRWHGHFCDASQWFGKLPAASFAGAGPSLVGCAHKFGGPKGVGFFRAGGTEVELGEWAWQFGGPQEQRVRAGTEDVAGVAAMLAALEWCEDQMPSDGAARDEFEHSLGWPVVGGDRPRLWNTSLVVAPRHQNKLWLARLSQRGFQCSTGSACSSGHDGDSHVLAAMGLEPDAMRRVLRFSSGWTTTRDDWRALHRALAEVERELDARFPPTRAECVGRPLPT